jgi:hypothetical protein
MFAVIRAYNGNFDLADTLAEHEEEIRQLIGGINEFRAYYLLKLTEGRPRSGSSTIRRARKSQVALPPRGWPRICQT